MEKERAYIIDQIAGMKAQGLSVVNKYVRYITNDGGAVDARTDKDGEVFFYSENNTPPKMIKIHKRHQYRCGWIDTPDGTLTFYDLGDRKPTLVKILDDTDDEYAIVVRVSIVEID